MNIMNLQLVIHTSYFLAAILFIFGLQRMSSPVTARNGIVWAGAGMVLATLVTFLYPGMSNFILMLVAIGLGGIIAWISGKKVEMTDMPQMIALYNGMGGGAAAAIAAIELFSGKDHGLTFAILAILGGFIGAVSFSGSLVAFAKLQGFKNTTLRFPGQQALNFIVLIAIFAVGAYITIQHSSGNIVSIFFLLALILGITMTVPIGGADMPVVISLYNAFTGLAVAFEGFVQQNPAMIIAGTVVGAAGSLLTQLMAKAMNRSLTHVLFSGFGETAGEGSEVTGSMKPIDATDVGVMMAFANKVLIVPGYGMAVAQAQHALREMCDKLKGNGVKVSYAIHPVAGRMPGHMNVLLAEANVPYDEVFELESINSDFSNTDVAFVIGANDVTNPAAKTDPQSPIYGMPILDVENAKSVLFVKRGMSAGYAGVDNELFFKDNTLMLFSDAKKMVEEISKSLD